MRRITVFGEDIADTMERIALCIYTYSDYYLVIKPAQGLDYKHEENDKIRADIQGSTLTITLTI